MTMPEVVDFISGFATVSGAPVRTNTTVTSVTRTDDGYRVVTSDGEIRCRSVVLASGGYNVPSVPAVSASLPPDVEQITPFDYRDPSQLPDGGVLVVGASATGAQLADEIHRSGRPVTLAVGEHVRLPRRYRGRDVLWWMDRSGVWNERYDAIDDLTRARRLPSPQLVGTPRHDARPECAHRDRGRAGGPRLGGPRRLGALLRRAPEHVRAGGPEAQPPPGHLRRVGARPWRRRGGPRRAGALRADARARIVAACGSISAAARSGRSSGRPASARTTAGSTSPSWTRRGTCATTAAWSSTAREWCVLGLPVLRRRKSSFIYGAEDDARELVDHLAGYLDVQASGVR